MKKSIKFQIILALALVVLFGGRTMIGHAQDANASPADQAQTAVSQDFSSDVSAGEQQLAQDPDAAAIQESVVSSEDQTAGDTVNSGLPVFTSIDEAQVDIQTPGDTESMDLSTSEVTQELDANDLTQQSQDVMDSQEQDDQQQQEQDQDQDQSQTPDEQTPDEQSSDQSLPDQSAPVDTDTSP